MNHDYRAPDCSNPPAQWCHLCNIAPRDCYRFDPDQLFYVTNVGCHSWNDDQGRGRTHDCVDFLRDLYAHRGAHLVGQGVPLDDAKAEARTLAESVRDALLDGTLQDLGENPITRELAGGVTPEEFRRGPVSWGGAVGRTDANYSDFMSHSMREPGAVPVLPPQMRNENRKRETDPALTQMRLGGEAA